MGCAYPIKVKNPLYEPYGIQIWKRKKWYFVPCGYCLNCMIQKRTWLKDVCDFEYNRLGMGTFCTLTYDDENIVIEKDRAVLNYKDFQDFNKRLREILKRKYGRRVEYKYVVVGEYGTQNERPHMHILFFGLNWQKEDKEITEAWKKGIVMNLPIKKGGISYVLKYLDKDRIRNNKHYNENKDLRPFLKHSVGLANEFIQSRIEEIVDLNGCYSLDNGQTLKPIPSYYMRKLRLYRPEDTRKIRLEMEQGNYLNKRARDYTAIEIKEYKLNKARRRLEAIIYKSRDEGEPQEDFDETYYKMIRHEMI